MSPANTLRGNGGSDKLYGLSGNDVLIGGSGKDLLSGGGGNDAASYAFAKAAVTADLQSASSNRGEAGGDTYVSIEGLIGSAHSDNLRGNGAANTIEGEAGNDTLYGRGGNDVLDGGAGRDKLYGQGGKDLLIGGSGADTFVFQASSDSRRSAVDTIQDFVSGSDRIDLRGIDAKTSVAGDQAFTFIGKSRIPSQGRRAALCRRHRVGRRERRCERRLQDRRHRPHGDVQGRLLFVIVRARKRLPDCGAALQWHRLFMREQARHNPRTIGALTEIIG